MKLFQRGEQTPGIAFVQEGLRMARESALGLWCTIVEVTPEMAGDIMTINFKTNRTIKSPRVDSYAKEIAEGTWAMSNDFIVIDRLGRLVNGQHRLTACQQSGESIIIGFLFGVEPAAVLNMDTGYLRTQGQTLHFLGYVNATQLAAVASYDYRWRIRKGNSVKSNWNTLPISRETLAKVVEKRHHIYSEAIRKTLPAHREAKVNLSVASLCYILFSERASEEVVDAFFHKLATGEMLQAGDPILALRKRLLSAKAENRRNSIEPWEQVVLLIKTWNFTRTGAKRNQISWREDEAFPEPK